jgi:hypothetical protein
MTADALARGIVIETDLVGLAQGSDTAWLMDGLPVEVLPALAAQENGQHAGERRAEWASSTFAQQTILVFRAVAFAAVVTHPFFSSLPSMVWTRHLSSQ